MSFGLQNAAPTFQCFINKVLHGLEYCHAYIDIFIASEFGRTLETSQTSVHTTN